MLELNKIYNIDCLDGMKQLDDCSIDMILTDPPYGINYQSARRIETERFNIIDGDDTINGNWIKEAYRILKNNTAIYVFTRWDVYPKWSFLLSKYFKIKSCIIWDRIIHGLGDLSGSYAPQYDMCIFAVKGKHKLKSGRPKDIIRCMRVNPTDLLHPTQKPVKLLEQLIINSSCKNEIICDPFIGSGSTAIACKHLFRNFIGFEISEEYCKIANDRLKNITDERLTDFFNIN